MKSHTRIPKYVLETLLTLRKGGFEACLVGGCVRDIFLGREPKDWDVTTNATPEEIQSLFPKTVYENKFGTVAVIFEGQKNERTGPKKSVENLTSGQESGNNGDPNSPDNNTESGPKNFIVEVTPYRIETTYSDFRHPDEVKFAKIIDEDLKRRDFTINAMAYDPFARHSLGEEGLNTEVAYTKAAANHVKDTLDHKNMEYLDVVLDKGRLVDLFGGLGDIKDKVLKAVGDPNERFREDALRMMRAVRFSTELGFAIDGETLAAIAANKDLIKHVSFERIHDEFEKIIMSPDPVLGIGLLQKLGLLTHIIPELEEGVGCEQKGEHIYDVFEHMLHALGHAASKDKPLHIRLAALFHDIGKPRTRRWDGTKAGGKGKYTFYGHEVVGAKMTKKILERLKFPKDLTELVVKLVRYHMFFSDTEAITLSAVRRTIVNVGRENIWDLMEVRECDRVGMKKKEAPYRLRKYHAMIEEALRAPTSVGMLKIDGNYMIKEMGMKPGPRMGWILHALLEECLEDDSKNTLEYLKERVLELDNLSDKELKDLGEAGKQAKEEKEGEELQEIRKKHGV